MNDPELVPIEAALRREFWALPSDAFVDRATAGASFYLSIASMEAFAIRGDGPRYTRLGRRALYRKADLLEWAQKTGRKVESTAQLTAAPSTVAIPEPLVSEPSRSDSEATAAKFVNPRSRKACVAAQAARARQVVVDTVMKPSDASATRLDRQ